ncbi:MAG: hypothetical protein ABIW19_14565 [Vicinamibacterales bacterium]
MAVHRKPFPIPYSRPVQQLLPFTPPRPERVVRPMRPLWMLDLDGGAR